jgi:PAS domain S-box-containing protein
MNEGARRFRRVSDAPAPPLLLVDDREENLLALEVLLEPMADLQLVKATSAEEALRLLLQQDFALVLLDVQMPGMDGFEMAELMRANPKTRHVPIIFVSAQMTGQSYQFKGYEAGAVDYLSKPIEPLILRAKVGVFVLLYRQRKALEEHERYMAHLERLMAEHAQGQHSLDDTARVLLVDDRAENLLALEAVLADIEGLQMVKAGSGAEALRALSQQVFAVVLLDVQMPGMDGFETAERIRAEVSTNQLPIIFVTAGMKDHGYQFKGYEHGAVDYLIKPLEPVILRSKVKVFCDLFRQRHRLEQQGSYLEGLVAERTAELQRTARQLENSREGYRRLLESVTSHRYVLAQRDGRLQSSAHSAACEALTGYPSSAYEADPELCCKLVAEADRGDFIATAEQVLGDGQTRSLEHRILLPSGALRWMRSTFVLRGEQQGPVAPGEALCDVLVEDIDERKGAEETQARLAERLDLAARSAHLGIWDWNIASDELVWDARMFELYGMAREEFACNRQAWLASLHPDDRDECVAALRSALHNEGSYELEYRVIWADGSLHHLKGHGQVIRDAQGQALRLIGVNYDISERKHSEAEILRHRDHLQELVDEQAANLRAIVEYAADGIVTLDQGQRILSFNPAAERMFGYSAEAVLGQPLELLIPEPRSARFLGAGSEMQGRRQNASLFPLYIAVSQMEVAGEPRFIAVLHDISAQKEAEASLVKAREEAEAANEAKSAFIANMSHEIRTPMNAIIGMTDLLLESPLQAEQSKLLRSVAQSAKALLGILNDILDMSKLDSGMLELESLPFNLRQLCEEVTELFRSNATAKGLSLELELDASLPDCQIGDPTRLRQVLLNLLGNAIKFTEQGGVRLRVLAAEAGRDHWLFRVEDSGIGIQAERLPMIFERFAQADQSTTRRFGGTGLGTTISRGLVERMGGQIWAQSVEGQGSVFGFSLCLPEAQGMTECTETSALQLPREVPRIRPLQILLVDDIPLNQELLVRRLQPQGHQFRLAENGRVALELFRQERFDLVLMDAMMPELDGVAATRAMRELEAARGGHVPLIMLSASVLPSDRIRYYEAGADAFVGKPIDFGEFYSCLAGFFPVLETQPEVAPPAPDMLAELPQLAGLDLRAGLAAWGELAVYRRALGCFRDSYGQALSNVRSMLEAGQRREAFRLLHTLKGLAGNLGAYDLAALLGELEPRLCDEEALPEVLMAEAERRLAQVLDSIAQFKRTQPAQAPELVAVPRAEPLRLIATLECLLGALERGELDEDALEQLRQGLDSERFGRLEVLIDSFDFAKVRSYVLELLGQLRGRGGASG